MDRNNKVAMKSDYPLIHIKSLRQISSICILSSGKEKDTLWSFSIMHIP